LDRLVEIFFCIHELANNIEKGLLESDLQFAVVGEGRAVPIEFMHLERYLGRVEATKVSDSIQICMVYSK